jgi:hypothetical protein
MLTAQLILLIKINLPEKAMLNINTLDRQIF